MTAQDVQNALAEVQVLTTGAATVVETVDPALDLPVEAAERITSYLFKMLGIVLTSWEKSANTEITPETIAALKSDTTPLVPPATT